MEGRKLEFMLKKRWKRIKIMKSRIENLFLFYCRGVCVCCGAKFYNFVKL